MRVEVDDRSGFCFGVVRAISRAEAAIAATATADAADGDAVTGGNPLSEGLVSLGDIVHNGAETARLAGLGLQTVPEDEDLARLAGRTVLIRAHGEPPETYLRARKYGITLVDATCPVVERLQRTVARAHERMRASGGTVAIFGRRGHAEVRGLAGQVASDVEIVEGEHDLDRIDFSRPVYFLAQTTGSLAEFTRLGGEIVRRADEATGRDTLAEGLVTIHDTVCRQVSGREDHLAQFARRFDAVVFVSGAKSSNGRVLFEAVRAANPRSHKIESAEDLRSEWFSGVASVGVCGATSTPRWLMEQIAEDIRSRERPGPKNEKSNSEQ